MYIFCVSSQYSNVYEVADHEKEYELDGICCAIYLFYYNIFVAIIYIQIQMNIIVYILYIL